MRVKLFIVYFHSKGDVTGLILQKMISIVKKKQFILLFDLKLYKNHLV